MMSAQIEGSTEVIDAAISESWEAGAVAVVLLVMLVGIGYLMRAMWQVNQRLSDRVTGMESTLTTRMMTIVEHTTAAVTVNTEMLARTAAAIEKLELVVEQSLRTQQVIVGRLEASPCLMTAALSKETQTILRAAQEAAEKKETQAMLRAAREAEEQSRQGAGE